MESQIKPSSKLQVYFGMFYVNDFMKYWVSIQILTVVYTYHLALIKGEVLPFPYTSITGTLIHYPQCMIFRILFQSETLFNVVVICAYYKMINFHLLRLKLDPVPLIGKITGIASMGFLSLIGATVENGKQDGELHDIVAVSFFVCQIINIIIFSLKLLQLKLREPELLSWGPVIFKLAMGFLLILACLICIPAIIIASKKGQFLNLNSGCWIDILEWTAFGFILPFFISEGFDLNRVSFIVTNTDSTDNEPDEELTKQMNEYENFIMQQQQNKISYDNIDESQLELQNYQ